MDDREIVKACAEAMGISVVPTPPNQPPGVWNMQDVGHWAPQALPYNPLTNDAQVMALGKAHPEQFFSAVLEWASSSPDQCPDLNRILCCAVAQMQRRKDG